MEKIEDIKLIIHRVIDIIFFRSNIKKFKWELLDYAVFFLIILPSLLMYFFIVKYFIITIIISFFGYLFWRLTARFTNKLFPLLMRTQNLTIGNATVIITIPTNSIQPLTIGDKLKVAIQRGLYPIVLTFFIVTLLSVNEAQKRDVIDVGEIMILGDSIWIIPFAPIIAFLITPIFVAIDSSFYLYHAEQKWVKPIGEIVYGPFKAIIGTGAILSIALKCWKLQTITNASVGEMLVPIIVILYMITVPIILVTYFYNNEHQKYVECFEVKIKKKFKPKTYKFEELKKHGILLASARTKRRIARATRETRQRRAGRARFKR